MRLDLPADADLAALCLALAKIGLVLTGEIKPDGTWVVRRA
jgi:hypothetical protein